MQKNNNETQNYRDKNGAKSIWKRKKSYALMLAISSAMYGNAYAEETPDTDALTTQEKTLEESTGVVKRSESMHNHEEYLKLAKLMDLNS